LNENGFVIPYETGIDGLKQALTKIDTIKPEDCRKHIEDNFSTETMVTNYDQRIF
jgi:hypothetical protein